MKLCCMADVHGILLQELPECDCVLIAGDIAGPGNGLKQREWWNQDFRRWLDRIKVPVFACAGNHDWSPYEYPEQFAWLQLPWTYLQDESATFNGWTIYGTPWQRVFYNWAFNLTESELMGKWNLIPDDTNILICHSPPKFYGDQNSRGEFCGSESLGWRIGQLKQLRLCCFGHIHPGRGIYHSGETTLVNAAMVNDHYKPVYEPFIVELEGV